MWPPVTNTMPASPFQETGSKAEVTVVWNWDRGWGPQLRASD